MKKHVFGAVAVAAILALAACGGGEECPTGGRGSLSVGVTGLPDGVSGVLVLRGPDGAERATTGSGVAVFDGIESGRWTLRGDPVAAPGGRVRRAFDVAEPVEVCVLDEEQAMAQVAYAEIPTSARLWMVAQSSAGRLLGFAQDLLGATATVSPSHSAFVRPELPGHNGGIAFDKRGNLWAADATGSVKRIPASSLQGGSPAEADIVITGFGGGLPGPTHLAFDDVGNLWVSIGASRKVVRLSPDQLALTGAPVAAIELSTADEAPGPLAFDAAGNLWVGTNARLHRFDAGRLTTTLAVPNLSLEARRGGSSDASLGGPSALAFDAAGNLWGSFFAPNVIARFTPAELNGDGERQVVPSVQLALAVSALLDGLVFDEEEGLWTPLSNGQFGRLSPAQLAASGTVTPEPVLTSSGFNSANELAVYPAPAFTPLHHRLP